MNTEQVTPQTITSAQIKALRAEAVSAGDHKQVRLCDIALGRVAHAPAAPAREACCRAINQWRAAQDRK